MKTTGFALALFGLAACGGGGGGPGGGGGDGGGVDTVAATMITISGVSSSIGISGRTPLGGVAIAVFKASDDSLIAMTTSDMQGVFSISAPSNGAAIDGYLKATIATYKDTYLYPPGPLSSDFANVPVLMLTQSTQNLANQLGGAAAPSATKAWIGAIIDDAAMAPVMGAVLTSSPAGEIKYNGNAGIPQAQATSTAADGIAYSMNVAAGDVTLGATKAGSTFHSHTIKARADKVTLTLVTP
jgi:hypothetical protein